MNLDILDYYHRTKKHEDIKIIKSVQVYNQNPASMISFFTPKKSYEMIEEDVSAVKDLDIPKNVESYTNVFRAMIERDNRVTYKNLIEHKEFDYFKRTAFHEDQERFAEWSKKSLSLDEKKFGYLRDSEPVENPETHIRVMKKIFSIRQSLKNSPLYEEIKRERIRALTNFFEREIAEGDKLTNAEL